MTGIVNESCDWQSKFGILATGTVNESVMCCIVNELVT